MQTGKGILSPYNSLKDPYLGFYFSRKKIQHHLKKSGLITKNGQILSEAAYTANLIKVDKEEKMKQMMIQEIVERSVDRERKTHQIIKAKLEEIAKLEAVRSRKNEEFHRRLKMNEVFMPALPLPNLCMESLSNDYVKRRSCSSHGERLNKGSLIEANSLKKQKSRNCRSAHVKGRNQADVKVAYRITQQKIPSRDPPCIVKLYYHGRKHGFHANSKGIPPMDYIKVEQQINEAASVVVFRAGVTYNTTFWFASLRKTNSRFSLTFYIDGLVYCNISSCCEFKHKKGSRIGGKYGLFSFAGVQNGVMCYLCEEAHKSKKLIRRKKKVKNISANLELTLETDLPSKNSIQKEQAIKNYEYEIAKISLNSSIQHETEKQSHCVEDKQALKSDSEKNGRGGKRSGSNETGKDDLITKEENICSSEPELHTSFRSSNAGLDEESLSHEVLSDQKQVTEMGEVHYQVSAENGRAAPGATDVESPAKMDEIIANENEALAVRNSETEMDKTEIIEHSASLDGSDFSESDDSQNYFEDSSETESTDENSVKESRQKS